MEGDPAGALESYTKMPSAMLDQGILTKYFVALAKKANGNLDESKKILEEITKHYAVTWDVGLARNLAIDQLAKW